jgi:hypothetical protein
MSEASLLQRRVRADRHATSYPLIVVGAVGFHYSAAVVAAPVNVVYGIPLAFVIVWALQWRNERRTGVGTGNDETLLIAFGVFLAASAFSSHSWLGVVPNRLADNAWFWSLAPAGIGIAALGVRQRSRELVVWGIVVAAGLAVAEALNEWSWDIAWTERVVPYRDLVAQITFLAVTVAGAVVYRRERAISES